MKKVIGLAVVALGAFLAATDARADWTTARGNAQRTGNVDGQAGPKAPKVLWVYESTDHYVSAPSPGKGLVYMPALGTLNSGVMSALSVEGAVGADKRVVWSKSQPFLKLPTVCSPAVVGGRVIFGDGMHQNSNPTLYCVDAQTGATPDFWQALTRYVGFFVSVTPLLLGFVWVAFDARKQAWHDKMARTVVIHRRR